MTEREEKCLKFVIDLLEMYEFELYMQYGEENKGEKVFKVKDLQGGNLGNIENDEFVDLGDLMSRMGVYHNDYIFEPISEGDYDYGDAGINEIAVYLESDRVADTLMKITADRITDELSKKFYIELR